MPVPLLGFALQSLVPPAQPRVVSNTVTLVTFEPSSGFCSTRESATRFRRLKQNRAHSSLELFALQGFRFFLRRLGVTLASPHAVLPRVTNEHMAVCFRVSNAKKLACLSRDCRPSWAFRPLDCHVRLSCIEILESPLKALGVRCRPLISPS
jgi:hypothetical protein